MNSNSKRINLLNLSISELNSFFLSIDQKEFRTTQLIKWVHQNGVINFENMTNFSKPLRNYLNKNCVIELPKISHKEYSEDGTKKWLLEVGKNESVEMVLIPEKGRNTLCVSSQVGCVVNCSFCATGKQGFSRNLSLSEIIGQVLIAENSFGMPRKSEDRNITNIVMMGMGEPLLNFDNVVNAMEIMRHDSGYNLSKRKVTLSTSGLLPEIEKLSKVSDVSLTISLHAPNNDLRDILVPINKKYPIQKLLKSVKNYVDSFNDKRITTFEYILINKVNDSLEIAKELANLLEGFPCKINLIPFNEFSLSNYSKPSNNRVRAFKDFLVKKGFITTIRSTRGDDIMAACGQLVGQVQDKTNRKKRINQQIESLNLNAQ